jgi:hypothetical protein
MQPTFTSLAIAALTAAACGLVTLDEVFALSTQDCKNVGGTVVEVADDRCGASRQYCRMPDTNAVCINVRNLQLEPARPKVQPKLQVLPKGNIQKAQ